MRQAKILLRVQMCLVFCFFLLEMIICICCFGLYKEENSYLKKSPVHVMNILILIFEALEMMNIIDSPFLQKIFKIKLLDRKSVV